MEGELRGLLTLVNEGKVAEAKVRVEEILVKAGRLRELLEEQQAGSSVVLQRVVVALKEARDLLEKGDLAGVKDVAARLEGEMASRKRR